MNLYDIALKIWIARKISSKYPGRHYDAEMITDVKFAEAGGYYYSEYTFDWDKGCITFKVNGKEDYIEIENDNPAKLIEECLNIYKTLSHLGAKYYK